MEFIRSFFANYTNFATNRIAFALTEPEEAHPHICLP